jgi:hypothetical protein
MQEERPAADSSEARDHRESEEIHVDLGPDPVWGVSVGIVGLLIMATGGAMTWHYVFNVGEGIMLLGAVMFLYAVARTALIRHPLGVRERLPAWFGGVDDEEQ